MRGENHMTTEEKKGVAREQGKWGEGAMEVGKVDQGNGALG